MEVDQINVGALNSNALTGSLGYMVDMVKIAGAGTWVASSQQVTDAPAGPAFASSSWAAGAAYCGFAFAEMYSTSIQGP
jgi:hypothetical protein